MHFAHNSPAFCQISLLGQDEWYTLKISDSFPGRNVKKKKNQMFGSAVYMYTENISSCINPALQINWTVKASLLGIATLAIWCRYSFSHEFPLLLYDESYRTTR